MTIFKRMSSYKVPWEPYKAAIADVDTKKNTNYNHEFISFNSINLNNSILTESINKDSLVKYKIDTDLELFNAQRPGYQFNDTDIKLLNQNQSNKPHSSFQENLNNQVPEFKDARFYTDFHFLKLANELKAKCLENSEDKLKSNNFLNKPVNVVGFNAFNF